MHRHVGGRRAAFDGPTLSADIATGFGPECVTARGAQIAFPYLLQVEYAARGAMGYAFGAVHVMPVDRHGEASFEMRPFVLMKEGAFVELGSVRAKT